MPTERFQPRDIKIILAVVAIVVVSILFARANFSAAFPQASIDLRFSKDQIIDKARQFLVSQGLTPEGFRNLTLFDSDETARTYLEREVGLQEANKLMSGPVSVWRWRARWFQPPEKEERIVWLSPTGTLVGFERVIPEAAPGARLTQDQALAIAQRFLEQRTADSHHLVEQQRLERPNRYDYVFRWERDNFAVKDATYRRVVTVQGDRVGEYQEALHVPEQWERDYAVLRSRNELFASIANLLYVPLVLAAAAVIIMALRRRALDWRPVLLVSGAVAALMVLNQWNSLAFSIDQMPTSSTFLEMVSLGVLQGMGAGVLVLFYVGSAAAAGEPLYRQMNPGKLRLSMAFSREGAQTKEFFLATVVGYGMAAFHIAFVVAFYVVAQRYGAWSPQDIQYSDLLSTWAPWLYPLAIAAMAASAEEFWFRLFGVSLLQRYVKVRWLAVVIPAFVWGFLHSNYPQQPAWIRGVEVGLIGVVAGFVMLRFGILATLVWHYTVDAVLIGMFLFAAPSLYFRLSGYVTGGVVLLPLAASLALYVRRGGFLVTALPEPVAVEEPAPPEAEVIPEMEPETTRALWRPSWLVLAALAASILGLVAHPVGFGDSLRVKLTRNDAKQIADAYMRSHKLDPSQWRDLTEYIANLHAPEFEYLRRQSGRAEANRLVQQWTQTNVWRTNYFRPLQKEEWYVYVDQNGKAFRTDHQLGEDAAGAGLAQDEARRRAEEYLKAHGISVERFKLMDAQTEKRAHRTDHSFIWESTEFHSGEAAARVSTEVIGDEVSNFRRFLKLPEQWMREYEKPRMTAFLFPATLGVMALPLLIVFLRRVSGHGTPAHRFHWSSYAALAVAGVIVYAAGVVNGWPNIMSGYSTDTPLENYVASLAASRVMLGLVVGAGFFFGAMAFDVFAQAAMGIAARPLVWWHAAAAAVVLWGTARWLTWLEQMVPGPRFRGGPENIPGMDSLSPAWTVLQQAFSSGVGRTLLLGIGLAAFTGFVPPRRRLLVIGGLIAMSAGSAPVFPLAAFAFASGCVWVAVALLLLRTCDAEPVTFAVAFFWLAALEGGAALLEQPNSWFQLNGGLAVAAALAIGFWALTRQRIR